VVNWWYIGGCWLLDSPSGQQCQNTFFAFAPVQLTEDVSKLMDIMDLIVFPFYPEPESVYLMRPGHIEMNSSLSKFVI